MRLNPFLLLIALTATTNSSLGQTPADNSQAGAPAERLEIGPPQVLAPVLQPTAAQSDIITPATSDVMPPAVPPRPLLVPATVAPLAIPEANDQAAAIAVPPALAWRVKAQDLKMSNTAPCRVVSGQYDDVLLSLLATLPQFNLQVEMLNSNAGELLAASRDPLSQQKVIFVIAEMPAGTVTIKAISLKASKQAQALVQNVLQTVNVVAGRRGTL